MQRFFYRFCGACLLLSGFGVAHASTVAYWRFEEGAPDTAASATILDSSGNSLSGLPVNSPVYRSNVPVNPVPRTGSSNTRSLDFGGTNQMVAVPDYSQLRLTHSLTLEAYVNVRSVHAGNGQYIVFRGDDRNSLDPYVLQVQIIGTGSPQFTFSVTNQSNSIAAVGSPIPSLNQWHHVAGMLDESTDQVRLYVDGQLSASAAAHGIRAFDLLDPGQAPGLGIGNVQDPNYPLVSVFNGHIDEVRISDQALLPGQFLNSVPEPIAVSSVATLFPLVGRMRRR
jgi:hypothetical protein